MYRTLAHFRFIERSARFYGMRESAKRARVQLRFAVPYVTIFRSRGLVAGTRVDVWTTTTTPTTTLTALTPVDEAVDEATDCEAGMRNPVGGVSNGGCKSRVRRWGEANLGAGSYAPAIFTARANLRGFLRSTLHEITVKQAVGRIHTPVSAVFLIFTKFSNASRK